MRGALRATARLGLDGDMGVACLVLSGSQRTAGFQGKAGSPATCPEPSAVVTGQGTNPSEPLYKLGQ